ncbi:MAG TPA: amidohydrolase [Thermodesulfobacteriota bacterium]|nr:amidohydrolase [Thermodesulfobacteriota bacterium]
MGFTVDADIVLLNGNIITMDQKRSRARGAAIKDGRFLWVGTDAEVKQAIGKSTQVRDLKGQTVTPGFIESHNHTMLYGLGLTAIDLSSIGSIEEIVRQVKERAAKQKEGTWITGVGYNQNELKEKRHPTRDDLDGAAPKHLVKLRHTSAHGYVVNSPALGKAGIAENTPDPEGGKIARDAKGRVNGLLFETPAMKLIDDITPRPGFEELVAALGGAGRRFLSEGITSAMDASVGGDEIPLQIGAYQEAIERGILKVRSNLAIWGKAVFDYARLEESLDDAKNTFMHFGIRTGFGDERLRVGPFKIIVDGAFSTVTAVTHEPYGAVPEERGCGVLIIEPEKLARLASRVHALGWQLSIHGIGDRAIDMCLDAIEAALKARPAKDARPRLEHATMLLPRMLDRIKKYNVIPVLQPAFIWELADNWFRQLGKEKCALLKPFKTLQEKNIPFAFSSDRPVVSGAPLLGIHSAANQKTRTGQDFAPMEKITAEEALAGYTVHGAYASLEEKIKGSIEKGKLADLVVLAEDLTAVAPEKIKDIAVMSTMVGGEFCFDRG